MNAADHVLPPARVAADPHAAAILFHDERLGYGELLARVNRFGNGLAAAGVQPENRIVMLLKDSPDLIAAYLGAIKIGAVAVAINLRSSAVEFAFVLRDSRAAVLLIDAEFLPLFEAIRGELAAPPRVFVRDPGASGYAPFAVLVAGQPDALEARPMSPDDMAFWIYTSGTTGTPKAAVHLHHDVLSCDRYVGEVLGVRAGDRLFATSKLFFAYSLGNCLLGGLTLGATLILLDGWPDGAAVAKVVDAHQPTVLFSVPTMYRNMLREGIATRARFASVRLFVSAGERLPVVLLDRWKAATGSDIVDGMGTSETIYIILSNTPGAIRPGASGRPVPGSQVELRDEHGRTITEPGTPGVLYVSMPSTCDRYWNQQERSQAVLRGAWFRTGDVYVTDADGYWYHEGRADDMLKISGQWVSPMEIEEAALKLAQVADAAVVGVASADGLTRLALFVVAADPQAAGGALRATLQEALRASLSVYKCPREVVFIDEMPRTATGKVQRFKLRGLAQGQ